MDFSKIFIKNACPTRIGGQAVMSGIMMRGEDRTAVVLRKKDGTLHMKTQILKKHGSLFKIPLIRGIFVFVDSLVMGTSTLRSLRMTWKKSLLTGSFRRGSQKNSEANFFGI